MQNRRCLKGGNACFFAVRALKSLFAIPARIGKRNEWGWSAGIAKLRTPRHSWIGLGDALHPISHPIFIRSNAPSQPIGGSLAPGWQTGFHACVCRYALMWRACLFAGFFAESSPCACACSCAVAFVAEHPSGSVCPFPAQSGQKVWAWRVGPRMAKPQAPSPKPYCHLCGGIVGRYYVPAASASLLAWA